LTIFNRFENYARSRRKDHLFIADPIRHILVKGKDTKVEKQKTKNFSQHIYWPLRNQFKAANSNYATTYANWVKVYDSSSDQQVWVPYSGFGAGLMAQNDPWDAPAGFTRGINRNITDIAFGATKQKQRDQLYKINLNPIYFSPVDGYVTFGQKTLQTKPSAFDRINVRRTFLFLEKATKNTVKYFVFEPNTLFTRTNVVNVLTPIFELVRNEGGVYDYKIICDERNNTPDVIDQNQMVVDIYIQPTRTAEFILCNFYATRTGVNFDEIIINN
jgi:phage tail sheath protein FI